MGRVELEPTEAFDEALLKVRAEGANAISMLGGQEHLGGKQQANGYRQQVARLASRGSKSSTPPCAVAYQPGAGRCYNGACGWPSSVSSTRRGCTTATALVGRVVDGRPKHKVGWLRSAAAAQGRSGWIREPANERYRRLQAVKWAAASRWVGEIRREIASDLHGGRVSGRAEGESEWQSGHGVDGSLLISLSGNSGDVRMRRW